MSENPDSSLPPAEGCVICGSRLQPLFSKYGHLIRRCAGCGHQCCSAPDSTGEHVVRIYGDDYFQKGGAGYSNYVASRRLVVARGQWYGKQLTRHTTPGSVLDVGAAAGFILRGLLDEGWTGRGIEPNDRMARFAREHVGVDVQVGTLEDLPAGGRYDLVSMIQVVAHFVDPRRALSAANEVTKPGGYWLIETWDRESWFARLCGRHWHEYSPPSVLHWFSKKGLARLAADFGFHVIASGRPLKSIDGEHLRSLLPASLEESWLRPVGQIAARLVPRRLVIPHPGDDVFWMLFRGTES